MTTSRLQIPVLKALLVQCSAIPLSVIATGLIVQRFEIGSAMIASLLLLQGAIAAGITKIFKLAIWWIGMQFFFPITLYYALQIHLPPIFFLAAFLGLLTVYWTTFRTQVPFYPSNETVWAAVLSRMPPDSSLRFIDIGSGVGGLAMNIAFHRPFYEVTGVEIAPVPWLLSKLRNNIKGLDCLFLRKNYERMDLSCYDVVFAYLSPAAMPKLWKKLEEEMQPGSIFFSYEFIIEGIEPSELIVSADNTRPLYMWRF